MAPRTRKTAPKAADAPATKPVAEQEATIGTDDGMEAAAEQDPPALDSDEAQMAADIDEDEPELNATPTEEDADMSDPEAEPDEDALALAPEPEGADETDGDPEAPAVLEADAEAEEVEDGAEDAPELDAADDSDPADPEVEADLAAADDDAADDDAEDTAADDGAEPSGGEPVRLHGRARHEETEELLGWLRAAPAGAPLILDASAVDNVSTPYVLAIVAAARLRADAGSPAIVTSPSPAFVDAFSDLGLFGDLMKMEIRA